MEKIILEYHPFPFLKYKRKIHGNFPSTFDELKPKQMISVSALMNDSISETAFLKSLTGIPKFRIKRLGDFQRYSLMKLFEPFINIKPYPNFVIPSITVSGTLLLAPKPKLTGVTLAQFIYADTYFTDYQNSNNNPVLLMFVSSLYLPDNVPFSEERVQTTALSLIRYNPHILNAIVLNYVLVKEWLILAYPMVFVTDKSDDDDKPEPKKKKPKQNNNTWIKIFDSIVGDDIVNYDKYALLPVNTVFRWMTTKIKENMKNK